MILTETIQIRPNSKTLVYYKNLGYDCELYSKILIPTTHLTQGSHQIINVMCDYCNKGKKISYNTYWRNTKGLTLPYSCSEKCGLDKRDNTNISKYGVKNVFENDDVKKKIKESYLKNLNVDHPSKSPEIQQNTKNTNLDRYGFTCSILNKEIKEKIQLTCLNKYGVINPFQNDKSQQTKKNKIIDKYKSFGLIDIENGNYILNCDKGHITKIEKSIFHNRFKFKTILCTDCNPIGDYHRSGLETEISDFITNNYNGKIELNKKFGYKEIDIYLPDLKLAIEFNGLYWHNELNKSNNYHQEKTDFCQSLGFKLIHIYEDDWLFKKEIVKSRILNLIGKSERIYARKCEIREINNNEIVREFLNNNHIQGFVGSKVKLGLFYKDSLVSLMTFGNLRKSMGQKSNESYEMLRFCNKLNTIIIGGASKLFKYFIDNYKLNEIISYADRSWSSGELYEKLGFNFIHKTQPNYFYVIDRKRYHRFNFRKDKLIKDGFDPNKTEHQVMLDRKIFRIYDSGSLKYSFTSH